MKLLLISNSTNAGEPYLHHPKEQIATFLKGINKVLFLPYAAVTFSFNEYERKVQERFSEMGIEVDSLHHHKDAKKAVKEAEAFVVGGGNTFRLAKMIQQLDIIETLRYRALEGVPYVGWSAGANVACPTICTTNDMPIVEPDNFSAFNLVRFQINPHYLDANPDGHAGETREQRIEEFLEMDPYVYVVGLREGSMLLLEKGNLNLVGPKPARIFRHGTIPKEVKPGDDLDFLFE
ncbi:MAG TPA: dipeptidase PepE [Tenuifilaceae bacterium]|nr:dipeptidase PepE [Tenuifilaceae bacterium]HPE17070.1 dipeptidase PepE [Tenuifilaceae bacterium]HPJ44798.1 dipeptidase PepE [Tenuifilaceae bacterium]HPQ32908.1 dipeptidase PepE [Tenuifilaceae bacterium]HRX66726.1 dipeptidase PepE [Tenuifilaceae bacterium]